MRLGVEPDRVEVVEGVADALVHATERAGLEGQVVVSGSLYVVGAARAALHPTLRDAGRDRGAE